jgi:hypothetical protein
MEILSFVTWVIGWPVFCTYDRIGRLRAGIKDTDRVLAVAGLAQVLVLVHLIVAYLLWSKV